MKIMLLTHTYLPARGGIENYLRFLSRELVRMGHEPVILCKRHSPDLPERESIDCVEVLRHPDWSVAKGDIPKRPMVLAERLRGWLGPRMEGAHLILSRFPLYGYAAARLEPVVPLVYLPAALSAPLVRLTEDGFKGLLFAKLWEKQLRSIEEGALRGASHLVVFSRNMARQIGEAYGIETAGIDVVPPGVDTDVFRPRPRDGAILEELEIPAGASLVLYVGRLSPEKNIPLLLRAVEELGGEDLYCVIVGGGPSRKELVKLASRLGIRERVRFTGEREDVERFYSSADLFVLPSLYEAFGQVILEAMASGLPVVALKNSPPVTVVASGEIIEEGKSGWTIPPSPTSLKEKMSLLLSSAEVRLEMGKRGRERALERYTWEAHLRGLMGIVDRR